MTIYIVTDKKKLRLLPEFFFLGLVLPLGWILSYRDILTRVVSPPIEGDAPENKRHDEEGLLILIIVAPLSLLSAKPDYATREAPLA